MAAMIPDLGSYRSAILFLTLVIGIATASSHAAELRCDIRSKFSCTPAGCQEIKADAWNLIDLDRERYSRCDQNGCDSYAMLAAISGVYVNIDLPGRATPAKLRRDGAEFVEVVTLGTQVFASFGACE